jgi:hypothetical protein
MSDPDADTGTPRKEPAERLVEDDLAVLLTDVEREPVPPRIMSLAVRLQNLLTRRDARLKDS